MVSLVLEEGLSNEVASKFDNDQMDVAFVRAPQVPAQGVVVTPLQEEPMIVALPGNHPLRSAAKPNRIAGELGRRSLYPDRSTGYGPARRDRYCMPSRRVHA